VYNKINVSGYFCGNNMTCRRNTINIYDYPEHLNPFREDADDNNVKFNTTDRRCSSFRVNAW
jgi:hypothetical protein